MLCCISERSMVLPSMRALHGASLVNCEPQSFEAPKYMQSNLEVFRPLLTNVMVGNRRRESEIKRKRARAKTRIKRRRRNGRRRATRAKRRRSPRRVLTGAVVMTAPRSQTRIRETALALSGCQIFSNLENLCFLGSWTYL